jgi:hypothetical protein
MLITGSVFQLLRKELLRILCLQTASSDKLDLYGDLLSISQVTILYS